MEPTGIHAHQANFIRELIEQCNETLVCGSTLTCSKERKRKRVVLYMLSPSVLISRKAGIYWYYCSRSHDQSSKAVPGILATVCLGSPGSRVKLFPSLAAWRCLDWTWSICVQEYAEFWPCLLWRGFRSQMCHPLKAWMHAPRLSLFRFAKLNGL